MQYSSITSSHIIIKLSVEVNTLNHWFVDINIICPHILYHKSIIFNFPFINHKCTHIHRLHSAHVLQMFFTGVSVINLPISTKQASRCIWLRNWPRSAAKTILSIA